MPSENEAKFNSSVKTSDYIREWCIDIGVHLESPASYKKAHHILWMVNNEIYGWYMKKNVAETKFKELEEFESNATNLEMESGFNQANKTMYGAELKKWSRAVVKHCYEIGWLAKENENIYDQDLL